jgi:hypothetical protein
MSPLVDLGMLVSALEAAVEGRANGRTGVAHRLAAIAKALAEGIQACLVLDAVVANLLP